MSDPSRVSVSLALQGGASLGAYTSGVLDSLIGDERLHFEGVTGASAGAFNAVALADGFARDGRAGARASLRRLWETMSIESERRRRRPLSKPLSLLRHLRPGSSRRSFQDLAMRALAPFEVDPVTMEPFRGILEELIDWPRVRSGALRVFVNASNVRTRELRVFAGDELSPSAVCASACIPFLWEPVEIGGEHYWDGGFLGNPALFPVIYGCQASEILLIETRPAAFERLPESAGELIARVTDLCSTAGLVREVRAIDFISQIVRKAPGALSPNLREIRVHRVAAHAALAGLRGNPFRSDLMYCHELHALGAEAGRQWLERSELLNGRGNVVADVET